MIAFGVAISDRRAYERFALPGIERASEPGSVLLERFGLPIARAYNELLADAAALPGLEALVLLHQDLELCDASLPGRLRRLFADRRVGLAGALGVRNLRLHVWLASRDLHGGVRAPGVERRFSDGPREVEAVDGALLALAPWVVRGLRFGEPPGDVFHGYDMDIALRVRAYGGKVVCEDVPHYHHREPKDDFAAQRRAGLALAAAWDPELRPPEWDAAFER